MVDDKVIQEGFAAAGERMDQIEGRAKSLTESLGKMNDQVRAQLRAMIGSGHLDANVWGKYQKRFWPTREAAGQFGRFTAGVVLGKKSYLEEFADVGGKALTTGPTGGYLVPDTLANHIVELQAKYGVFRAHAQIVGSGTAITYIPKLDQDLTIYCPGEGNAITASDISISMLKMELLTWAALTAISKELDSDSLVAVGEIIGRSLTRAMAQKEDACGFAGDGTAPYFNVVGIRARLKAVDATPANIAGLQVGSGNAYAELSLADFEGVVSRLPDQFEQDAAWFMHRKFYFGTVLPLARAAAVSNINEVLSEKKYRYLYGYPVRFTPYMPSTEANSQVCAVLADLSSGAALAEKGGLEIDRSEHVLFNSNAVAIRGTQRTAINVYGVGDTSNAGPICGLITAAA